MRLHFEIPGRPAAQGSKRHVGGGRMIEQSKYLKPWRTARITTWHATKKYHPQGWTGAHITIERSRQ